MPTQDWNGTVGGEIINSTTMGPFTKDAAGEVTNQTQPAFLARNAGIQSNVTGDGTTYTVLFDTEVFDQNADFASNTFTAPVTGKYQLSASVLATGITAGDDGYCWIATSNRAYRTRYATEVLGFRSYSLSVLADMDAGDTATVVLEIGAGLKTVSIAASTDMWFSGYLAC